MDWTLTVERKDGQVMTKQGTMAAERLVSGQGPRARVLMGVGYAAAYGTVKVYCEVQVECDQTAQRIDQAGRTAYETARDLAREAYNVENPTP